MEVGRGARGYSQRSTACKRSLSVEWDLFRAAKQGGKIAGEEIKLEAD